MRAVTPQNQSVLVTSRTLAVAFHSHHKMHNQLTFLVGICVRSVSVSIIMINEESRIPVVPTVPRYVLLALRRINLTESGQCCNTALVSRSVSNCTSLDGALRQASRGVAALALRPDDIYRSYINPTHGPRAQNPGRTKSLKRWQQALHWHGAAVVPGIPSRLPRPARSYFESLLPEERESPAPRDLKVLTGVDVPGLLAQTGQSHGLPGTLSGPAGAARGPSRTATSPGQATHAM